MTPHATTLADPLCRLRERVGVRAARCGDFPDIHRNANALTLPSPASGRGFTDLGGRGLIEVGERAG